MKLYTCPQGGDEWRRLRLGVLTASQFDRIITPLFKPRDGKGVETFLCEKLCEKILGFAPDFSSFAVDQGVILEGEAIPWYELERNVDIKRVGFCTTDDGRVGCSPDGLIRDDGGIEIKCPQPHTHLRYLMGGVLPDDYAAQVHGSIYVTGRKWWDFMSYSRQFEPLVVRVPRDERIMGMIDAALQPFLKRFEAAYARIMSTRNSKDEERAAQYRRDLEKDLTPEQLERLRAAEAAEAK